MLEEIKESIKQDKEILETLPQNNVRNRKSYKVKLEEILDKYYKDLGTVYDLIVEKRLEIVSRAEEVNYENVITEYEDIESKFYLFDKYNTSYEKLGLDRIVRNLRKFYQNNIDEVNNNINSALEKFQIVGINLTYEDFNHSIYINEYMRVFIEEKNAGNINSETLKNKFEKLYWKCPDIITHLVLNIIYIYNKNKKVIDKYFETKKHDVELENKTTFELMLEDYQKKVENYDNLLEHDKYLILHKYTDEDLKISDYTKDKIDKLIENLVNSNENEENTYQNLIKFRKTLNEYRKLMDYQYIVDDIKEIYAEKNKYKDASKIKYKDIVKKESTILGDTKTVDKLITKAKDPDKIETLINKINAELSELNTLYKELDLDSFKEQILLKINDNSTIMDVLTIATSFYNYIVDVNNRKNIECESVQDLVTNIRRYVNSPYDTIINNVLFNKDVDIPMVISDQYKLFGFKINPDLLTIDNIDSLIGTVNNIIMYYDTIKTGYTIEELLFVCDADKIIKAREDEDLG